MDLSDQPVLGRDDDADTSKRAKPLSEAGAGPFVRDGNRVTMLSESRKRAKKAALVVD